jgi:hypothetical protein
LNIGDYIPLAAESLSTMERRAAAILHAIYASLDTACWTLRAGHCVVEGERIALADKEVQ